MQKFTVFSIILSISVVLIIGDIVFHDYLNVQSMESYQVEEAPAEELSPLMQDYVPAESGADLPEEGADGAADETEANTGEDAGQESAFVELSDEGEITLIKPELSEGIFISAGFFDPVLKDTIFSGYVFNFIGFTDQSQAFIYQWNLFNGEEFAGSVYEIKYPTETGSFQGYLTLRDRAQDLTNLGTVNEVNTAGDASFYFNHITKTKTVHAVVRKGNTVYAFEYAYKYHDYMKKVFEFGLK